MCFAGSVQNSSAPNSSADVTSLLLAFLANSSNAQDFAIPSGQWQNGGMPCSPAGDWLYVVCTDGQVTGLNFTGLNLGGAAPCRTAFLSIWTLLMVSAFMAGPN